MNGVKPTPRRNIKHFEDMNPVKFLEFACSLPSYRFNPDSTFMKIDGVSIRFGKDPEGRAFFESARSGPMSSPEDFLTHAESKNGDIHRAKLYRDMFAMVKKEDFFKDLPYDTKVVCEALYVPMATPEPGGLRFVNLCYDETELGIHLTLFPFHVLQASTGVPLCIENQDDIIDNMCCFSGPAIMIEDPLILNSGYDFRDIRIELGGCFVPEVFRVLKSRKAADRDNRKKLIAYIRQVQKRAAALILSRTQPNKYLGPEIEGYVIWIDGAEYKIVTPYFRKLIKK